MYSGARKVDVNQPEIVRELRARGYSVWVTSSLGDGGPDIVVGKNGRNWLFEIKRDSRAKLTEDEQKFQQAWRGQYTVVISLQDCLDVIES